MVEWFVMVSVRYTGFWKPGGGGVYSSEFQSSSNPFRIRIFFPYSFGIKTINKFIHSRSSLENHTRFDTDMGKVYTRFQTKTAQNPTRWGGMYLYGFYEGVMLILCVEFLS